LALVHGYVGVHHPKARIVLDNGQEIKGRLVKVGKFVSIVQEVEEKKVFINSSKIAYVEEDMFKEKPKT
jgi:small nuclear ribonucleoprotein (snRNP)-like protein